MIDRLYGLGLFRSLFIVLHALLKGLDALRHIAHQVHQRRLFAGNEGLDQVLAADLKIQKLAPVIRGLVGDSQRGPAITGDA